MSKNNIVPTVVLPDGNTIPAMGFGTGDSAKTSSEVMKNAILEAIKAGYKHIDTAAFYGVEDSVGDAIEEAFKLGLIKSRDELFVTSKLWLTDTYPDRVIPALKKSLGILKLEYIDLYLIHLPITAKPSHHLFPLKEDMSPIDSKAVWPMMEECKKLGLTKSIGVCNFPLKALESLMAIAKIPPAVNQVEMNITCQQKELRKYCKENDIFVTAYSPLGGVGSPHGNNRVVDNETLKEIAKSHGKSIAQVALRWLYEQGVCVVVRSYFKDQIKENLEIFNWSLTQDDLEKISQIKQIRINIDNPIFEYIA